MDRSRPGTFDRLRYPYNRAHQFVEQLHADHVKFVPLLSPGIRVEKGYWPHNLARQAKNAFLKRNGKTYVGRNRAGPVWLPDFLNSEGRKYWADFIQELPRKWFPFFDGLWIDVNEPAQMMCAANSPCLEDNGDPSIMLGIEEEFDAPENSVPEAARTETGNEPSVTDRTIQGEMPYETEIPEFDPRRESGTYEIKNLGTHAPLFFRTSPMDVLHSDDKRGGLPYPHYDVHNLYGLLQTIATNSALRKINGGKRPFVLSRSTFAGSGHYGSHWTGDNKSSDDHLQFSIPGILHLQMFGITSCGADIGGFFGKASDRLLARWMQVGAFYPFARNHNVVNAPGQEPYRNQLVADVSRAILKVRYSLLPYWYSAPESVLEAHCKDAQYCA